MLIRLCGVTFFRYQILIILLSFEIRGLSIFVTIFYILNVYNHFLTTSLYILIIVVCEASLGLSLLVVLTRAKGDDNLIYIG